MLLGEISGVSERHFEGRGKQEAGMAMLVGRPLLQQGDNVRLRSAGGPLRAMAQGN